MKILITGAGGFIGGHVLCGLEKLNQEVISLDIYALDIKKYESWKYHKIKEYKCKDFSNTFSYNVTDLSLDESVIGNIGVHFMPDVIMHLAGLPIPAKYISDPSLTIKSNLYSTINLLNTLEKISKYNSEYKPVIIFSSTSEVYGNSDSYDEDTSKRMYGDMSSRRWCYAISKALCEELIIASGYPYIILRPFNIIGPFIDEFGKGRVVTKMIGDAINKRKITVTDGGSQIRSFTHIDDMTTGILEIVNRLYNKDDIFLNQIFNIGTPGNSITMMDLATLIRDAIYEFSTINVEIESINSTEFYGGKFDDIAKRIPCTQKWEEYFETRFEIDTDKMIYELCELGTKELKVYK